MVIDASYTTVLRPFNHDNQRGKWSSPMDYFYACLGHAFKVDAIFIMPSVLFKEFGIYGLIPHLIVLLICVIPIVLIQSFLGQYSKSGFISAFRISPLFKGIGYVALTLNLTTLTYYSIFGAIPLFYLFHSLRTTLPWSCEGASDWIQYEKNATSPCFGNDSIDTYTLMQVPSLEFFKTYFKPMDLHTRDHPEATFLWSLVICTLLIWIAVGVVLSEQLDVIARFIRYSCLAVIGIMCLCVLRFALLPGASVALRELVMPQRLHFVDTWAAIPLLALTALGPGWGSVLTMASLNKSQTNIFRYSWMLCLAQLFVLFGLGLMAIFISSFLQRANPENIYFYYLHNQWMEFLITPTVLTFLELPHFWTLLFFIMMLLGSLNLLIVQLLSVLISLFDEYESLRAKKKEVTLLALFILALTSTYMCSNYGMSFAELLAKFSIMTQIVLNLLLLLVVLWVYGRKRFHQDLNCMTGLKNPTWMVNIANFVAPFFLFLSFFVGFVISWHLGYKTRLMVSAIIVIAILPWLLVPGYCIFKLAQTRGTLRTRLRTCIRPTSWYLVDLSESQQYIGVYSSEASPESPPNNEIS